MRAISRSLVITFEKPPFLKFHYYIERFYSVSFTSKRFHPPRRSTHGPLTPSFLQCTPPPQRVPSVSFTFLNLPRSFDFLERNFLWSRRGRSESGSFRFSRSLENSIGTYVRSSVTTAHRNVPQFTPPKRSTTFLGTDYNSSRNETKAYKSCRYSVRYGIEKFPAIQIFNDIRPHRAANNTGTASRQDKRLVLSMESLELSGL